MVYHLHISVGSMLRINTISHWEIPFTMPYLHFVQQAEFSGGGGVVLEGYFCEGAIPSWSRSKQKNRVSRIRSIEHMEPIFFLKAFEQYACLYSPPKQDIPTMEVFNQRYSCFNRTECYIDRVECCRVKPSMLYCIHFAFPGHSRLDFFSRGNLGMVLTNIPQVKW